MSAADYVYYVIKTENGLKINYTRCIDANKEYTIQQVEALDGFEILVFSPEWENYFFKNYKELSRQLCFIF